MTKKPLVVVCSYESVANNLVFLRKQKISLMVVDEGHRLKNSESIFFEQLSEIKCCSKLLITGTPLSNNIKELFSLLNFLMPKLFNQKEVFEGIFEIHKQDVEIPEEEKEGLIQMFHRILEPLMLRRLKQDTNLKLPPKKEMVIKCPLTQMQLALYKTLMSHKIQARSLSTGSHLMDLRLAAIHPYLFPDMETSTEDFGDHLFLNSGKFIILDKLLSLFINERHNKVLIFSQFTAVLNIVQDYLNHKKLGWFRLDGNTPVEERYSCMEEFNSPDNNTHHIFLLSTRAGGLGINLVAANVVIFLDSDWNPQMDMQAMDRAHRIGQKKNVTVLRLISSDTIEERILSAQNLKIKLDFQVVERGRGNTTKQSTSDFNLNKLSERDKLDLAHFGANKILKLSENTNHTDENIQAIDINKLIEESEKLTEEENKTMDEKIKQFTEKAT